jgi:GNAT superfamily N-acetyltransferase
MIEEISFDEILPFWRDKLWPDRISMIEPASSMLYLGGYDVAIKNMYKPRFFAVRDKDCIVGVNSGHQTTSLFYRSRGIYVEPTCTSQGAGRLLIAAVEQAAKEVGCKYLWSIPRLSALPFYEKCGFKRTSELFDQGMEFGPNCYCLKELSL